MAFQSEADALQYQSGISAPEGYSVGDLNEKSPDTFNACGRTGTTCIQKRSNNTLFSKIRTRTKLLRAKLRLCGGLITDTDTDTETRHPA